MTLTRQGPGVQLWLSLLRLAAEAAAAPGAATNRLYDKVCEIGPHSVPPSAEDYSLWRALRETAGTFAVSASERRARLAPALSALVAECQVAAAPAGPPAEPGEALTLAPAVAARLPYKED